MGFNPPLDQKTFFFFFFFFFLGGGGTLWIRRPLFCLFFSFLLFVVACQRVWWCMMDTPTLCRGKLVDPNILRKVTKVTESPPPPPPHQLFRPGGEKNDRVSYRSSAFQQCYPPPPPRKKSCIYVRACILAVTRNITSHIV